MAKKIRIAIAGSRGIPNLYGGFEQCAQYLSIGLLRKGYEVTVFNSSEHSFQQDNYNGVNIEKVWCPESIMGSSAHFIYDWLCLKKSVSNKFDIVLELGYQSSAPAIWFYGARGVKIITNMDGLEWSRSKWGKFTRYITQICEKVAINYSDCIISDNEGIQEYFIDKYNKKSEMIPYGAELVSTKADKPLYMNLQHFEYHLIIARLEPENSIEVILDGYVNSNSKHKFIVVGSHQHKYAKSLLKKYRDTNIEFFGAIFDKSILDDLRNYALVYWHGHTVGGTNPSLLEAMAANAFIASIDNRFNNTVLKNNSIRFNDSRSVTNIIDNLEKHLVNRDAFIKNNILEIEKKYSWDTIVDMYECVIKNHIK